MKRIKIYSLIFALILTLAACGSGSDGSEGAKMPESPSPSASSSTPSPLPDDNTKAPVTNEPDNTEEVNSTNDNLDLSILKIFASGYSWTSGSLMITVGGGDGKYADFFTKGLVLGVYALDAPHNEAILTRTMDANTVKRYVGGGSWNLRESPGEDGEYEVRVFNTDDINDLNDATFVKRSELFTVKNKP